MSVNVNAKAIVIVVMGCSKTTGGNNKGVLTGKAATFFLMIWIRVAPWWELAEELG